MRSSSTSKEFLDARIYQKYLDTLHLVCAVPDVCGALESVNGNATGARYIAWVDRHLAKSDAVMTGADWYKMRTAYAMNCLIATVCQSQSNSNQTRQRPSVRRSNR